MANINGFHPFVASSNLAGRSNIKIKMYLSLFQIFGVIVSLVVVYWTIRELVTYYSFKYLLKRKLCIYCLDTTGQVGSNAEWFIIAKNGLAVPICSQCKDRWFPNSAADRAIQKGYLKKLDR